MIKDNINNQTPKIHDTIALSGVLGGSEVYINNELAERVDFTSEPQAQIDTLDKKIDNGNTNTLNNAKTYTDGKIQAVESKIPTDNAQLTNSANYITNAVNDLVNYYKKNETYTQQEIDNKLSTIPKFSIKVVSELPTIDISKTTIYLLKSGVESQNLYTEYIYADNQWEKLGEQKVDLTGYATEVFVNEKVNGKVDKTQIKNQYDNAPDSAYSTQQVNEMIYKVVASDANGNITLNGDVNVVSDVNGNIVLGGNFYTKDDNGNLELTATKELDTKLLVKSVLPENNIKQVGRVRENNGKLEYELNDNIGTWKAIGGGGDSGGVLRYFEIHTEENGNYSLLGNGKNELISLPYTMELLKHTISIRLNIAYMDNQNWQCADINVLGPYGAYSANGRYNTGLIFSNKDNVLDISKAKLIGFGVENQTTDKFNIIVMDLSTNTPIDTKTLSHGELSAVILMDE